MPEAASPAQAVLAELGYALFARESARALRSLGKPPDWLVALWPGLTANDGLLPLAEASPFLENFFIDAEECWQNGGAERAKSGPWVEEDAAGKECQLEATALTVDGQALLLLERLGEAFAAKRNLLQRARETVIAHQRLNSEIQKKEILLHCVADEMTAALANAITALRLIEQEDNGPRSKLLLGLATRATEEQQRLIHRILAVFANELRGAQASDGLTTSEADAAAVLQHALDAAAPLFAEKGVRLERPAPASQTATIAGDPAQLKRLLANLLENALERTPAGGTVVVRATRENDAFLWEVEDDGSAIRPDACANLFINWDPAKESSPAAALRLHFCRIVVENCDGEMGCRKTPAGRNGFWVRLTTNEAA